MKKVLLLTDPQNADTLGSVRTTKNMIRNHVLRENGINIGNKVFVTAVEQYLTRGDIELKASPYQTTSPEEVSDRYDYVVAPFANIFRIDSKDFLIDVNSWISKLRIPFFVIGCGIQCRYDEQIYDLQKKIGVEVEKFTNNVYKTGGAIATRGYLTKEFLDLCGPNDAVATGCPALYRGGPTLCINKKEIDRKQFGIAYTSMDYPRKWLEEQMMKYPQSLLFDQGIVFGELFKCNSYKEFVDSFCRLYGVLYLDYLLSGRVYTPADIWCWIKKIRQMDFAYGSRIHGAIVAMQSGIPVEVNCVDSRVKEIVDFIGLPSLEGYNPDVDLYEEYSRLDYSGFNKQYKKGYEIFREFMISHGIVKDFDSSDLYKSKIEKQVWEDIVLFSEDETKKMNEYRNSLLFSLKRFFI